MQYQVPQFIELEDRIIGPLTIKQFLYLAFAGAILFVFWFLFAFYLWIIIAVPITALALAFAFLKINDRPFVYFFLSFVKYFTKPKLYIFSSVPTVPVPTLPSIETKGQMDKGDGAPKASSTSAPGRSALERSKLKELALNLDIGSERAIEQ